MEHIARKYEKPEVGVTSCMVESALLGGSIVQDVEMNYIEAAAQVEGFYVDSWSTSGDYNTDWREE